MPRITVEPKQATVSFRLPRALKAEFAEIAVGEAKPVGALLRDLTRERIARIDRASMRAVDRAWAQFLELG